MFLGPQSTEPLTSRIPPPIGGKVIPFNAYCFNVEPFILFRPLSSFTRWLIIVCVPVSHPDYNKVQQAIREYTSSIDIGSSCKVNLQDSSIADTKVISKHKWYTLDYRTELDSKLTNRIQLSMPDGVPDWYNSLYVDKIYNKTKGLVIYADTLSQIPTNLLSRSIAGLCTLSGDSLRSFLDMGAAKRLDGVTPDNSEHKIVGYTNCNKWTKCVSIA